MRASTRETVLTPVAVVLDGGVDANLLGGKGASLDRLVAWGLPVPSTGAATTEAYRRFVAQPSVAGLLARLAAGEEPGADEIDGTFAAGRFEPADAAHIVEVAREVADGAPLAVRSSATVEDLERSSFAGQYRSVLDVDAGDADAVLDAVRLVFASLWHPAPRAYRRSFGIPDAAIAMAAVLMRMVPARRAGVVFTVDPTSGPGSARVEWVAGLGESLVSGRTTPTAAVVPRHGAGRPALDPEVAEALALALRVEDLASRPQDVEWAWDGEAVWVVQARPITVTAGEVGDGFDDDPEVLADLDLTTAGIGEMLPGVLPPLVWGVAAHLVEEAFRRLLDDLGVLPDDVVGPRAVVRRVDGRAAMDFGRVREMAGALSGSAAEELEAEYFGSRRPGRPAAAVRPSPLGRLRSGVHDLRVLRSRRRDGVDAAMLLVATDAVLGARPDLGALDDRALDGYRLRLLDLAVRGAAAELGVSADATATHRRLQVMLARHLGEADAGRLAEHATGGIGVSAPLGPGSSAAVFAGATWDELGRTPPPPPSPTDPVADEAELQRRLADVRRALEAVPGWSSDSLLARLRLRAMYRLAREARDRLRLRERAKAALLALGGEVRRCHLEAGRRLAGRGVLDDPAEVDLLSPAELRAALGGAAAVTPDVVAHRRRWQARYAQDGPLPPRFHGRPERAAVTGHVGRRVEGWAASPGRYRGTAVAVASPADDVPDGAVVVAEATDPSWSPLFLRAGALVLDRGGPLSHAAILARELGLPAVLNVPGATALLGGHDVTVDGDAGIVVVHDADDADRAGDADDGDEDGEGRS